MSHHRRLKQRLATQTCYLCKCSRLGVAALVHEIVHGPGRILWGLELCAHHQGEKEQRRDEREDRLNRAGLAVKFAERDGRFTLTDGAVFPLPADTIYAAEAVS